jgi:hypothetical protein
MSDYLISKFVPSKAASETYQDVGLRMHIFPSLSRFPPRPRPWRARPRMRSRARWPDATGRRSQPAFPHPHDPAFALALALHGLKIAFEGQLAEGGPLVREAGRHFLRFRGRTILPSPLICTASTSPATTSLPRLVTWYGRQAVQTYRGFRPSRESHSCSASRRQSRCWQDGRSRSSGPPRSSRRRSSSSIADPHIHRHPALPVAGRSWGWRPGENATD